MVGALAGAAAGALVVAVAPRARRSAPAEDTTVAAETPDVADLEQRLARLERRTADLERSPAAPRARVPSPGETPAPPGATEPRPGGTPPAAQVDTEDPRFAQAVRALVGQMEVERQEARRTQQAARDQERVQRIVDGLERDLSLRPDQRGELDRIYYEYFAAMRARSTGDAGVPDRQANREQMAAIRQRRDHDLEQLLDAEQMQRFRTLDPEGGFGRGRRPGGGSN